MKIRILFIILLVIFQTAGVFAADRQALIGAALKEQARFSDQQDVLTQLVQKQNQSVRSKTPDRNEEKLRLEKIERIEAPFRASIQALAADLKKGDTISEFPGILALGRATYDSAATVYYLEIFWGYGYYEDGQTLHQRFFRFTISPSGNILSSGNAPVMETN